MHARLAPGLARDSGERRLSSGAAGVRCARFMAPTTTANNVGLKYSRIDVLGMRDVGAIWPPLPAGAKRRVECRASRAPFDCAAFGCALRANGQ